jgi:carbonic anhydrase
MSRINGFLGRRNFLKLAGISTLTVGAITACNSIISDRKQITIPETNSNPVSANEAQRRLIAGNQRFINQNRQYPNQSKKRLQSLAVAAILGCADSRVPPEMIFDQGFGDLFVVRVAGNVASNEVIGSLEYATNTLGTQLIIVLGHERCGAVAEAVKNEKVPGKIGVVIDEIKPALGQNQNQQKKDNNENLNKNSNNNAVIANIRYQTKKLQKNSVILNQLIRADRLKIVSAFYDIDTGKVDFIS